MNAGERATADADLIRAVGAMLARVDAPPPCLDETVNGLLAWRTVDAELTELLRAAGPRAVGT
jgi:hypothetical protein